MKKPDEIVQLKHAVMEPAFKGFRIEELRVGRVGMRGIEVMDRSGAIDFIDTLHHVMERTMRRRAGGHGTFPANLPGAAPTRLLEAEIAIYLRYARQRKLSVSFLRNTVQALRLLRAVCGNIPVSHIGSQHITEFWDAMRWWPSKLIQQGELKGLTDQQLIDAGKMANVPAPADSTLNVRMQMIAAFFNRLVGMRVLASSPCDGFKKLINTSTTVKIRRPFSDDELRAMFDPDAFEPWASAFPHCFWMPAIGLYTGARINEVAQLKVKDIEKINGIWCLHIRKTIDDDRVAEGNGFKTRQQLKGASSIRAIPIAQALLDAGLLDYVADIKRIPHARLFPHLYSRIDRATGEPDGSGYSRIFNRRFTSYIRAFVPDRHVAFHAFRHYFCGALEAQGVPLQTIAKLSGHRLAQKVPTLQNFYLSSPTPDVSLKELQAAVELLRPPVQLPRYEAGQFAKHFRDGSKLHE